MFMPELHGIKLCLNIITLSHSLIVRASENLLWIRGPCPFAQQYPGRRPCDYPSPHSRESLSLLTSLFEMLIGVLAL